MAKYGYRDITTVEFFDLSTGNQVIYLDYLQTASQSFVSEIVFAVAGRGAPKRVGFQSGNGMDMELKSGLITPEILAIMFGTSVATGVQNVPITEKIVATTNTLTLAATPLVSDLVTYPIRVAYSSDGTAPTINLTKVVGVPATTEYAITNNTITVNSATYVSGGTFIVTYYKASTASNKRVKFQSDEYSKAYKITGETLWKNESDDLYYPCRITIPKLQITIDGNVLNSAMNGDPTTPTLKGQCLLAGNTTDLIVFDIDEGEGIANP